MKKGTFSTRQKIKNNFYARVIKFGDNFIVKSKYRWGIVNQNEEILLSIQYSDIHWFDGGYAGIQLNNLWGLVDSNGIVTIQPQYDYIHYFSNLNLCIVGKEGHQYAVHTNNNLILRLEGRKITVLGHKLLAYSNDNQQLFSTDGTPYSKVHWVIMNIGQRFECFDKDKFSTLIKSNGEEIQLPNFEVGVFFDSITQFRHNNKYGIIDEELNIVVPNQYDFISVGNGVISISEGTETHDNDDYFHPLAFHPGKWFFWNYQFQPITPYKYDQISSTYNNREELLWFAQREGQWYNITPEGEMLFAKTEESFRKKIKILEKRPVRRDIWGKFNILTDTRYKGSGEKYVIKTYEGFYIRHPYYTRYTPINAQLSAHKLIGNYLVNKYGQFIPNPNKVDFP